MCFQTPHQATQSTGSSAYMDSQFRAAGPHGSLVSLLPHKIFPLSSTDLVIKKPPTNKVGENEEEKYKELCSIPRAPSQPKSL